MGEFVYMHWSNLVTVMHLYMQQVSNSISPLHQPYFLTFAFGVQYQSKAHSPIPLNEKVCPSFFTGIVCVEAEDRQLSLTAWMCLHFTNSQMFIRGNWLVEFRGYLCSCQFGIKLLWIGGCICACSCLSFDPTALSSQWYFPELFLMPMHSSHILKAA